MQPLHATSNFKTISFHQVKRSALRLGTSEYPMTTCELRSPTASKFKVDSVYLFGRFSSGFSFGFYNGIHEEL